MVSLAHALIAESGKFARHRAEIALKRDLVERGLEIDEVERVVAARGRTETRGG